MEKANKDLINSNTLGIKKRLYLEYIIPFIYAFVFVPLVYLFRLKPTLDQCRLLSPENGECGVGVGFALAFLISLFFYYFIILFIVKVFVWLYKTKHKKIFVLLLCLLSIFIIFIVVGNMAAPIWLVDLMSSIKETNKVNGY
jgi:hypothetical protein